MLCRAMEMRRWAVAVDVQVGMGVLLPHWVLVPMSYSCVMVSYMSSRVCLGLRDRLSPRFRSRRGLARAAPRACAVPCRTGACIACTNTGVACGTGAQAPRLDLRLRNIALEPEASAAGFRGRGQARRRPPPLTPRARDGSWRGGS